MAAAVSMPMGLVRVMSNLPVIPGVAGVVRNVEGVMPKFFPAVSQVIPSRGSLRVG